MANTLKTIRKRIGSVKNTQKITRAMKMVAAAKLRRSQQRLLSARPYGDQMAALVSHLAALESEHPQHPLLIPHPEAATGELIVLSSDRGFCGGFNGNLLRRVVDWLNEHRTRYAALKIHVLGKKGRDFFRARGIEVQGVEIGVYEGFDFAQARERALQLIERYQSGQLDESIWVYNRFKSALSQEIRFQKLLPIAPQVESDILAPPASGAAQGEGEKSSLAAYLPDYIYEPAAPRLLGELLPRYLTTLIFRIFLESIASEFGARMVAMDAATNNCSDMIDKLTLTANRLRQAAITNELMDIVNGAEALS